MLNKKERIHFIGIGGAGMFPMAEVLHRQGYKISGSDAIYSDAIEQLEKWGIPVQVGHKATLVNSADVVVYTSAVRDDNEELKRAKELKLIIMKRAVMLGDLMRGSFSIGVAGTHGKTTTTSLIATILDSADRNPTVIVGGHFQGKNSVTGAMVGDGTLLVAEADEYDRSFLQMYPSVAVITNIEADHLDIYTDLDDIKTAFLDYMHRVPFYGEIVACIDDDGVRSILDDIDKPYVSYGFSEDADFQIIEFKQNLGNSEILVRLHEAVASFTVPLLGRHNLLNVLASIVVAYEMGVTIDRIAVGLKSFPGVKRRMQIIGEGNGITIIDDYAHHPTEVLATLNAVREAGYDKVTVLFQPHLYTRTADHYKEFAEVLKAGADEIYIAPIYKAREKPIAGVTSLLIKEHIEKIGGKAIVTDIEYSEFYEKFKSSDKRDAIIVMGAGDIGLEVSRLFGKLCK